MRVMEYTERRRTEMAAATAVSDLDHDNDPGSGWIEDYYRRHRLASAVFPVDAAAESEYPFLRIPAAAGPAPAEPATAAQAATDGPAELVPLRAAGTELLDEYQGSGLIEATYLVRKPGGQVVQVSRLLYLVLDGIDGRRTIAEIAARVTLAFGRTVSAGNVEYLLANKLAPLGLVATEGDADQAAAGAPNPVLLGLKLRVTLAPAPAVQHIARLFRPLFSPVIVVAALSCLIGSDIWLIRSGRGIAALNYVVLHPVLVLLVLGLSILSLLFHECGHATACRYGGARPGVIGMGIYVIWPAFFTNVTDAYRLGRAGRIRTDLGGVYFNAIFALMLMGVYAGTGYAPLLAAVVLVHLEIVQQLLPSLRFDGYFILADLIGVPDLFRRIGPTLRSVIPGQPIDPRIKGLKRAARITLTAWVLIMVPLLVGELALIVLNLPHLGTTFARSLDAQARLLTAELSHSQIASGLLSVVSLILLILPMAGLSYILLSVARRVLRAVVALNRRRPVMRVPSVAVTLVVVAALAVYWGVLPIGHRAAPPHTTADRSAAAPRQAPIPAPTQTPSPVRSTPPAVPAAVPLTPVSAHGFDPLSSSDPGDENDDLAAYAIDGSPSTAWQTQRYLGSPLLGGLKQGTGLILDMGGPVRLSTVTVTFGSVPGADVAVEIGDDNTLAAASLATFTTVATADSVGGTYTFRTASPAQGRYVLIWFTKLPQAAEGGFQAQVFNVVIRGSR
jgi:putative peptide zinc metalloprotease protein